VLPSREFIEMAQDAYNDEVQAVDFYTRMAQIAPSEAVRRGVLQISRDELRHAFFFDSVLSLMRPPATVPCPGMPTPAPVMPGPGPWMPCPPVMEPTPQPVVPMPEMPCPGMPTQPWPEMPMPSPMPSQCRVLVCQCIAQCHGTELHGPVRLQCHALACLNQRRTPCPDR